MNKYKEQNDRIIEWLSNITGLENKSMQEYMQEVERLLFESNNCKHIKEYLTLKSQYEDLMAEQKAILEKYFK